MEPASSWTLYWVLNLLSHSGNSLAAIPNCSFLSFRPPLCWDLMAASVQDSRATQDLHLVHKKHPGLALPEEGVWSTFSTALCTWPLPATLAWRTVSEQVWHSSLHHTNCKRHRLNSPRSSLEVHSVAWLM